MFYFLSPSHFIFLIQLNFGCSCWNLLFYGFLLQVSWSIQSFHYLHCTFTHFLPCNLHHLTFMKLFVYFSWFFWPEPQHLHQILILSLRFSYDSYPSNLLCWLHYFRHCLIFSLFWFSFKLSFQVNYHCYSFHLKVSASLIFKPSK